jgi:hypothetical protein
MSQEKILELEGKLATLQNELDIERKERAELVDKMEDLLVFAQKMREQRDGAVAMAKQLLEKVSPNQDGIVLPQKKIVIPGM